MSGAYYNEIDPYPCQWLDNLIRMGAIENGTVDCRDIQTIDPEEVYHVKQCHFFAGIGGWSYALRLADWPKEIDVWTGSCPCQPFSQAGRQKGLDDSRHLWPVWHELIAECKPSVVFGEQVASPLGVDWFDLVSAQLEDLGYEVGAANLCAAGVSAPHLRQRLYFMAVTRDERRQGIHSLLLERQPRQNRLEASRGSAPVYTKSLGDPGVSGGRRDTRTIPTTKTGSTRKGIEARGESDVAVASSSASFWSNCEWVPCVDGKKRPVEPGTFPLAHGVPARVGKLRAYGNAIVPQVAQAFIEAAMSVI